MSKKRYSGYGYSHYPNRSLLQHPSNSKPRHSRSFNYYYKRLKWRDSMLMKRDKHDVIDQFLD